MKIEKLIDKIIPPRDDIWIRREFSNERLIDSLSNELKQELEVVLIKRLKSQTARDLDLLVFETLSYLKSMNSVPIMLQILNEITNHSIRLEVILYVYLINHNPELTDLAISEFKFIEREEGIDKDTHLIEAFYCLSRFEGNEIKELIGKYKNDSRYLVSYNANRVLNLYN